MPLTADHKPNDPVEAQRIVSQGGQIGRSGHRTCRVVWNRISEPNKHRGPVLRSTRMENIPFLAMARSLGKKFGNSYYYYYSIIIIIIIIIMQKALSPWKY